LMDDDRSDEEQKMITDVNKKLVASQEKRRSASSQKPFSKGDWVRLSNAAYVKATLRGNYEKFNPRWSTEVYRIRKVTGGKDGRPYQYQIESSDMDDPDSETTSKKSFYRELRNQEDLLKIPKVKPQRAPTALVRKSKEYDDSFPFDDLPESDQWAVNDRISVEWERVRKAGATEDDLVYNNPELLQSWLTAPIDMAILQNVFHRISCARINRRNRRNRPCMETNRNRRTHSADSMQLASCEVRLSDGRGDTYAVERCNQR
jgi:hypothetical protein